MRNWEKALMRFIRCMLWALITVVLFFIVLNISNRLFGE